MQRFLWGEQMFCSSYGKISHFCDSIHKMHLNLDPFQTPRRSSGGPLDHSIAPRCWKHGKHVTDTEISPRTSKLCWQQTARLSNWRKLYVKDFHCWWEEASCYQTSSNILQWKTEDHRVRSAAKTILNIFWHSQSFGDFFLLSSAVT